MDLVTIYGCLCDRTRLRLVHLLLQGPLCVCHFQSILKEPQVKVSKHLRYLRENGFVEAERNANMMIYRLPEHPSPQLKANLACLRECVQGDKLFAADAARLKKLRDSFGSGTPESVREATPACC